jgi:HSP20 family protein
MLIRWNDWGLGDLDRSLAEFDALRREMNRLFEGGDLGSRSRARSAAAWPRVGLYDQGSQLVVRAELPGVSEDDIQLTVDHGVLSLKGTRKASLPEGYSVHRQERADYQFARSFTLPCKVDLEKTGATMKNGLLTVTLPKAAEEQPRQIAVRAK